jgi:NADH-quinone oxidoreductase subunit E
VFSSELREKAEELVGRYPVSRSALLPLLHLVQSQDGYLSDDGIAECAQLLELTKAEVAAVATFYSMYKREPLGKHLVSVCTNFSCKVRGAQDVYDRLVDKLGVGHNETTPDGSITLEHAECLGNCEGAPIVSVDYYNYECLSPEGAAQLVDRVIAGDVPEPTRGYPSPGIREISHRLAGVGPHRDDVQRGERLGYARDVDGGVPPPVTAEVGPQAGLEVVSGDVSEGQVSDMSQTGESEFSEEREAQREAVRSDVRSAGQDPDEVEEEAGPDAREFPSREPDIEPHDDEGGSDV